MPGETVEIPKEELASVETLDELYDWLTAQNAGIMVELREADRKTSRENLKPGSRAMSHGLPSRSKLASGFAVS
jgi:hypothetical protein